MTLSAAGLAKSFPGVRALAGVDLTLHPGRILALLGENGAGKSTLIHLLTGSLHPDAGSITLDGHPVHFASAAAARRQGIAVVHQEGDLFPDLSVAENLGLEQGLPAHWGFVAHAELLRRTRAALADLGVSLDPFTPASSLTPGQRQLVGIAAALALRPRVLILDEPTSSLSAAETQRLFERLRELRDAGGAILYVSHRLEEVATLADEATVLRDGAVVWSGPLAGVHRDALIRHMVGREVQVITRPDAPLGSVLLRCEGLTAADGSFRAVSLDVRAGEVLGLYGLVGAGRTEWAQGILGLRPLAAGTVHLRDLPVTPDGPGLMVHRGLAYLPEDRLRQGLCRGLSIRFNVALASLRDWAIGLVTLAARERARTTERCQQLHVKMVSVEQEAGTLSGGNQQKVVLARWLERDPAVLILDEPTRGVDVGARAEVYAMIGELTRQGRAVVLISSDLPEVLALSHRIGVFREGMLVGVQPVAECTPETLAVAALPPASGDREVAGHTAPARRTGYLTVAARPGTRFPREALLAALVLLLMVALQFGGFFFDLTNLVDLATETSLLALCALAASLVLLAGGLDISLGAIMVLAGAVAGRLWQTGWPPLVAVAVAIGIGATAGVLNATLTLVGRVHPIVITLGTMSLYRGAAVWWLHEQDVLISGQDRSLFTTPVLGLSPVVWLAGIVALALALFLARTVPGRHLVALGSNPVAARRIGLSRARTWLLAFGLQGALLGLAALCYLGRSGGLQQVGHEDRTLEALAAAVVGGVAVTGGRGRVVGVLLGCLFLLLLGPLCQAFAIPTIWRQTLVGGVLLTAVLLDALSRRSEP
jgi:ABC-type sugar transport system ATPase subunit/ribose/xylose/arabinose/galactoside ABC-type transport system permease subunit